MTWGDYRDFFDMEGTRALPVREIRRRLLLSVMCGTPFPKRGYELLYRRRRRIGQYNSVVWRIRQAETSSKVGTWP